MGAYVLGMHRSGTSALARVVGLLLGYEGHIDRGSANPAGHWEHPRLRYQLERMFWAMNADWASPPLESCRWSDPRLSGLRQGVVNTLGGLGDGPWVLKDPRLCVAFEALMEVDQDEPCLIGIYREPEEVARSIQARDGYLYEYGLALWEVYTQLLLSQTISLGRPVLWLSYSDLIGAPSSTIGNICDYLAGAGMAIVADGPQSALESVDRSMRHQRHAEVPRARTSVLLESDKLLSIIRALTDGSPPSEPLPPISRLAVALIETRRPYIRLEQDNRLLVKRLGPLRMAYNRVDQVRARLGRPVPRNPFA